MNDYSVLDNAYFWLAWGSPNFDACVAEWE